MKITDIKVLEKTSKKGKTYKGIFAILSDGQEIFLAFVR